MDLLWSYHGFVLRSKPFLVTTDVQCSPLDAAFGARNGHYGGTFVLPPVDVLAVIFVRGVIAVWLSITAQGLADAAACRDSEAHKVYSKRRRSVPVLLEKPTRFFAGEAVATVIGYQTLLGCSRTRQRIPQRLHTVCPTKLRWLLQVAETELRQMGAQLKSTHLPSVLGDS